MLSLVIILLSRFNASRVTREEEDFYPDVTFYGPITSTWDVSASSGGGTSIYSPCYYLDYSGSLTLVVDNVKYKNPLLFCPGDASDIRFLPASKKVYYAKVFDLIDTSIIIFGSFSTSIYISTEAASFESPKGELNRGYYYDIILAPIPGGTVTFETSDDSFDMSYGDVLCAISTETKNSVTVTVKAGSGGYTFQKKISERYSIELPEKGLYVLTGKSGLSVGAIVGISVSAVVVSGSAVGASVFFFLRGRKRKRDSDSESES